ncbi:MAG TPA: choice-of-anchor D domain-containing protein [bacterium]|jgi:hypothetical protein
MRRFALPTLSLSLLLAVFFGGYYRPAQPSLSLILPAPVQTEAASDSKLSPMDVCFAPGTPDSVVASVQRAIWGHGALDYFLGGRWSQTATNGNTGSDGHPITLTYSFIPDGTTITDNWGSSGSVLFSRMNALFGSPAVWQAKFAQIFAEWSNVSGVRYVQVSDDGAAFGNSRGILGTRGDVRIGSKTLDGASNVLAYDFFPDMGDMVLDASENWAEAGGDYIFLRNVLAHEHGHGLGLEHVCPIEQTKLLEPFYTSAFDGPQHDDIRAGQRNYGDRYEPNNTAATATPLGSLSQDSTVQTVGLDHTSDIDYYSFAVPAGKGFNLVLQPVGRTYLNGQQNQDGSCSAGTPINTLNSLNLDLALYDASGNTLLVQSTSHAAGEAESIFRYPVPASGASYKARVVGSGSDAVQLYQLEFTIYNLYDPYLSLSAIEFDTTTVHVERNVTTYLVNNSPNTRQITGVDVVGQFTVSPSAPFSIPPHDSTAVTVTFTAASLGTQTGTLTITHDGPGGSLQCPLTGVAIGAWLQFVTSNTVNLGSVPVGSADSTRVPVRVIGNMPLTITSVDVPAPFGLRLNLPLTINPSQTVFFYPRYMPTAEGAAQAMILIHHNGLYSPDTMYVSGTATPAAADDHPLQLPVAYHLAQNYPNPFNPTTTISFDLPRATDVRLQVYDIEGRLVKELVHGTLAAGRHDVTFDGSRLASGLYFYRLTSPEYTAMSKMALIK